MSNPKFRDVSSGSKSLVLIEFIILAATLLLSINANTYIYYVEMPAVSHYLLFIFTLVFTLVVQLSSLSLGLSLIHI